jgi:very-short-patch-repair endonuclease
LRPKKPATSVRRARRFRRELTKPEAMLWQRLRGSPNGHKFRKQHPADQFDLDFFCAKANLAIEVDGQSHNMGDRPQRDEARDAWLTRHRIDTLRIPAKDVLADPDAVTDAIISIVVERKARFGKSPMPPSSDVDEKDEAE